MTREVWLWPNRRPLALSTIPVGLLAILGLCTALLASSTFVSIVGWIAAASGTVVLLVVLARLRHPRLAYENEHLLVFLRGTTPIRVPIDVVECFFLGQGSSMLPRRDDRGETNSPETSTVVVRLAEAAEAWQHLDVRPHLGLWCDGYITIRGTWCEPLTHSTMQGLNDKLIQTKRNLRTEDGVTP